MGTAILDRAPALGNAELLRYSRHLILPEVGQDGQRRLKQSRVLLIGAGGLGSPVALYLAAAGVGHLGLVDFDVVDESNLQRQILHGTSAVGRSKLDSAAARIQDLNPYVSLETYNVRLAPENGLEILSGYDVVVDGTDNFGTRYLVNDACVILGIPNAYASIYRFEGQASVFATESGPCYRCLFREPPPAGAVPNCAEGGVLGVLPGLLGTIQATEVLKLLLGIGQPLVGQLLLVDALGADFRKVRIRKDPACPACGTREIVELREPEVACATEPAGGGVPEIRVTDLARRIERGEDPLLLDVREPYEWAIGHLSNARLVPLADLEGAIPSLPRDQDVIVYCKGGARSARAVLELLATGYTRVWSLTGGINAWSAEIDPSVPQY